MFKQWAHELSCARKSAELLRPSHLQSLHNLRSGYSTAAKNGEAQHEAVTAAISVAMSEAQLDEQLKLQTVTDLFRRHLMGPQAMIRSRIINERLDHVQTRPADDNNGFISSQRRLRLVDESQQRAAVTLDLLRFQLKACNSPEDIVRVVSVAMRSEEGAVLMASSNLQHIVLMVLRKASPLRQLGALHTMRCCFQRAGQTFEEPMIMHAITTSAETAIYPALKEWLRVWRDQGYTKMRRTARYSTRAILQALKRGLTRTNDQTGLMEILCSLDDGDGSGPYHLALNIEQSDLEANALYLELLGHINSSEGVRRQWQLLEQRRQSLSSNEKDIMDEKLTAAAVTAFLKVHDSSTAWKLIQTRGRYLASCQDTPTWRILLEEIENSESPVPDLDEEIRAILETGLSDALEERLMELEKRMGIKWVSDDSTQIADTPGGFHVYEENMEQAIQHLADDAYKVKTGQSSQKRRDKRDWSRSKRRESRGKS